MPEMHSLGVQTSIYSIRIWEATAVTDGSPHPIILSLFFKEAFSVLPSVVEIVHLLFRSELSELGQAQQCTAQNFYIRGIFSSRPKHCSVEYQSSPVPSHRGACYF